MRKARLGAGQGRWAAACALAIMVLVAGAAGARSSIQKDRLHWSPPIHVGHNGIAALSCPGASMCVAGSADGLLVSTDPSGGASAWQLVFVPPASGNEAPQVTSVSCPSASFCAAVTLAGDLITSTSPAGGASAWKLTPLHIPVGQFPNAFEPEVSCASATLCVVISTRSRTLLSSSNPAGGASAWSSIALDRPLMNVTCTLPHLCLLGDDRGDVLSSINPTSGASAWRSVHVFGMPGKPEDLTASACATARYCMMGAIAFASAVLLFATDPTGNIQTSPGAWRAQVAFAPNHLFVSGSCVASAFCAFVTENGWVYLPTSSFRRLQRAHVDRPPSPRQSGYAISCASRHFCVIGGFDGRVFIGTG